MFKSKQKPQTWAEQLPATLINLSVHRRQAKKTKHGYQPSGWDLLDVYSGQIIAEFNDETAPPTKYTRLRFMASKCRTSNDADNGNELDLLFKEIYRLCYEQTMEAMQMIAHSLPEHEYADDGGLIARLQFKVETVPGKPSQTRFEAFMQGCRDDNLPF